MHTYTRTHTHIHTYLCVSRRERDTRRHTHKHIPRRRQRGQCDLLRYFEPYTHRDTRIHTYPSADKEASATLAIIAVHCNHVVRALIQKLPIRTNYLLRLRTHYLLRLQSNHVVRTVIQKLPSAHGNEEHRFDNKNA
jgi:hypothetical protein